MKSTVTHTVYPKVSYIYKNQFNWANIYSASMSAFWNKTKLSDFHV